MRAHQGNDKGSFAAAHCNRELGIYLETSMRALCSARGQMLYFRSSLNPRTGASLTSLGASGTYSETARGLTALRRWGIFDSSC
jgi:hypothetical protein